MLRGLPVVHGKAAPLKVRRLAPEHEVRPRLGEIKAVNHDPVVLRLQNHLHARIPRPHRIIIGGVVVPRVKGGKGYVEPRHVGRHLSGELAVLQRIGRRLLGPPPAHGHGKCGGVVHGPRIVPRFQLGGLEFGYPDQLRDQRIAHDAQLRRRNRDAHFINFPVQVLGEVRGADVVGDAHAVGLAPDDELPAQPEIPAVAHMLKPCLAHGETVL